MQVILVGIVVIKYPEEESMVLAVYHCSAISQVEVPFERKVYRDSRLEHNRTISVSILLGLLSQ